MAGTTDMALAPAAEPLVEMQRRPSRMAVAVVLIVAATYVTRGIVRGLLQARQLITDCKPTAAIGNTKASVPVRSAIPSMLRLVGSIPGAFSCGCRWRRWQCSA